jgi:ferredoxin
VKTWFSFALFFTFCVFLYNWKSGGDLNQVFQRHGWFPYSLSASTDAFKPVTITLREPGFYYSLAYCTCVVLFGIGRIRRRKTPYIKAQTLTLMTVQVIPLFLLPYFILPAMGYGGWFDTGFGKTIADNLFPACNYGHGREYWRAFGFILAWPLFIWNVFTYQPMWWWLVIGFVQTFVIIPLMIWRWGKGAYCGWVCSCGALAETLGDRHRTKMPHGPIWNRLNMTGQIVLAVAMLLFALRIVGWIWPGGRADRIYSGLLSGWSLLGVQLNYYHVVDIFLAGIVGVGMYFWFSGRVWCRFACPLAALMHIYARFSRFRIFPEQSKCISCNVCTSVCHQGIDIMNFANKGLPMKDPECVRCSACVQECPTGTLSFGRFGKQGEVVLDEIAASSVRMRETKS